MNSNYQVVILENPCLCWNEQTTQNIFSKVVKLKMDGYQYEYGQNVMPLNAYDFIGTHLVLCEKQKDDLQPVSIAKISRYSVCDYFNHSFQPIELAKKGGNNKLADEIEEILNETYACGREITYDSSWTVRPDLRNKKVANSTVLRIMFSLWVNYHLDHSIPDFIVSATLKVKTDKMFLASGCVPISENPYYRLLEVNNQEAMMLRSSGLSKLVLLNAEKYRSLWENRLIYGVQPN